MKKLKLNIIILISICIVVLFFSLKDDYDSIIDQLYNVNLWWFLTACIMMVLYFLIRSIDMFLLIRKVDDDYPFSKALGIVIMGQFFANITPSSFGTQPAQVYFLSKDKIKPTNATRIIVQYNVFYQMALVILAFVTIFIAYYYGMFSTSSVVIFKKLVFVSLLFHTTILLVLLGINFSRRTNRKIVRRIIKTLSFIRIVKNKDELLEKWDHTLNDFHTDTHTIFKNKFNFFRSLLINFIALILIYSIPLVLFIAVGDVGDINFINTVVSSSYTNVISSFIPSPGGVGGFEYFFMQFFGVFVIGVTLKSVMILWRVVTYYFVLLIGSIMLLFYKEREIIL